MKYSIPSEWNGLKNSIYEEYQRDGVFFLDHAYLIGLHNKTGAFARTLEPIIAAAEELTQDTDAALYALFLYRAMEDRSLFLKHLPSVMIPDDNFPFLAFLAFTPYIERLYDYLCEKNLPRDVIQATVGQFEDCLFLYQERFGRLGMNKRYFDHMQRYVDCNVLNIGRLRFEIHVLKDACMLESRKTGNQVLFPISGEMNECGLYADTPPIDPHGTVFHAFFEETETDYVGTPIGADGKCQKTPIRLSKSEYFVRLPVGAHCLAVHIPAKGAFTREACEESYTRAKEIFSLLFPDIEIKAFRCHSWMMAPELKEILREGSNLLTFQAPYLKYPCRTRGEDILNFVFKTTSTDYSTLPEDTSLQRALKQRYLSGNLLYEYNGIFTI
ncbi:MAG: hypothetical protein IJW16_07650 [Clostridia bacterium]|nr:hypothetical protein [Clostridia bacterium]